MEHGEVYVTISMQRWLRGALALIVLGSGCGPTPAPDAPAPATPISVEEFPERFADAYARVLCEATFGCATPRPDLVRFVTQYANKAECVAGLPETSLLFDMSHLYLPYSEHVAFDEQAAGECVAGIEALDLCDPTQDDFLGDTIVCAGVVEGTRELGDPCSSHEECVDGALCETGDDPCVGVCVTNPLPYPRPCPDEPCGPHEICAVEDGARVCKAFRYVPEGSACVAEDVRCDGGLPCTRGVCVAHPTLPGRGEPCEPTFVSNTPLLPCKPGLACLANGPSGNEGTCGDAKTLGTPCFSEHDCQSGLTCSGWERIYDYWDEVSEAPPTCSLPGADGAPCRYRSECASGVCGGEVCIPRTYWEGCR